MGAYKTIHQHKTQSDDPFKLVVDPTLYTGSGGVVLALQKVCQFLKHEKENGDCDSNIEEGEEETKEEALTPVGGHTYEMMKEKYEEALEYNMNLVKKDKNGSFENNCSSYFKSAHIGIHTIIANDLFDENNLDEAQIKKLKKVITGGILKPGSLCLDDLNEPEDEILFGTAGYLYVILTLYERLKRLPAEQFEAEITKVETMIKKVVLKLAAQTTQTITFDEEEMDCMMVVYPRYRKNKAKEYLGAAHGTFGVLQMILQAAIVLPELVIGNGCE